MRAKIAYGLQVHKDPHQFWWIFNAIYNPDDVFALHVDRKTDDSTYAAMQEIAGNKPNLIRVAREKIYWGGWSLAMVSVRSIRELLSFDQSWTHFINISGNCFPLQPRAALAEFLAARPKTNFVQLFQKVSETRKLRERIGWSWQEADPEPFRTNIRKPPPEGFSIEYDGEAWCVLSREFCEWIAIDPLAGRIQEFFRDAAIPEEMLMQTLLLNSPFGGNRGPCLWETFWTPAAYHPDTLTMAHADRLLNSAAFFARKFDETVDREILDLLAAKIGAPTR